MNEPTPFACALRAAAPPLKGQGQQPGEAGAAVFRADAHQLPAGRLTSVV